MTTPPWMEYAACLGVDPDLFFPTKNEGGAQAKAVCRGCAVRQVCLNYAIANHEHYGIWGGASERERHRIRRKRRLAVEGLAS